MTPIRIEAWPGLVQVYRIVADKYPDSIDGFPVDSIAGFYRFEALDADGRVTLYGFRWMGRILPDYAAFASADPEWARWVPKALWPRLQEAWQAGHPFSDEILCDTPES